MTMVISSYPSINSKAYKGAGVHLMNASSLNCNDTVLSSMDGVLLKIIITVIILIIIPI